MIPRRRLASCLVAIAWIAAVAPAAAWAADPAADYPTLEALEKELSRLATTARPSVVSIVARTRIDRLLTGLGEPIEIEEHGNGRDRLARRVGTGVVIDKDGHIATLASVVAGASDIVVVDHDGRRLEAAIKGLDHASGLAILDVENHALLQPVALGGDISIGSLVTTLGSGQDGAPSYSIGFVSGTGVSQGPLRRGPYLRLDAYTAPGAGGGPVFDSGGRLVGLLFAARGRGGPDEGQAIRWEQLPEAPEAAPDADDPDGPDAEEAFERKARSAYLRALRRAGASGGGVSYAIPVDIVRNVADQIIQHGSVRRPWLGVTIESTEPGEVRVTRVFEDSPAASAGLAEGDRILTVDGEPLSVAETLVEKIALARPGTKMKLIVSREGRQRAIDVTLGERDEPAGPAQFKVYTMRLPTARLGVNVEPIEEDLRLRIAGLEEGGLIVRDVEKNARADTAGIRPGDIIVRALGAPIRSIPDLRRVLKLQRAGEPMSIDVIRAGKSLVLIVPPPEPPEPPPAPAPPAPRPPRKP